MQDGMPSYTTGETKEDLRERGIIIIYWPPFSPNLNPIKKV
jgi:transposase